MKEVSKILIGSIELRLMKNAEYRYIEIFESGKWSKITATKLHQLSFDKKVENWLNNHQD